MLLVLFLTKTYQMPGSCSTSKMELFSQTHLKMSYQCTVLKDTVENGNIGKGFVKGFGIESGAIAESIAHDTHNIMVTGASYEDMAVAVNRVIEMGAV